MVKKILNISEKKLMKVDVLTGVKKIQNIFYEQSIKCFSVYDNDKIVGVITEKELVVAHPNRIAADVMSDKYICVDFSTSVWETKKIFELNKDVEVIFVQDENEIIGYLTRMILSIELGKSVDLLTGLYKSDYIFYNAYNLFKSEDNISIIFIDLDNFGYIDKKYGHIIGDSVLKKVADILKKSINKDSYLCRYAGDEFAVVTPYSIDDSKRLAQNIIKAINSYIFPDNIQVSASIGITGCSTHNKEVDNILELIINMVNIASLSSTRAKQKGYNSISIKNIDIDAIA